MLAASPTGPIVAAIAWTVWTWALVQTLRPSAGPAGVTPPGTWRWRLTLVAAALLFFWPSCIEPHELGVDESQDLAGAATLWADPVFWRSVDGTTAGPLHYYLLMPAALAHASAAYFWSRLTGHLLVLAALFLTGRLLGRFAGAAVERAAVFAAASSLALSRSIDFQYTSTEVLPAFLLALAAFSLGQPTRSRRALWVGGLALGMVPWAKLQAAPIALGFGLLAIAIEWREKRHAAVTTLVVSGLAATLIVAVGLTLADLWPDMVVPYLLRNARYPLEFAQQTAEASWSGFLRYMMEDGYAAIWVAVGALLVLLTHATGQPASAALGRLSWFAAFWLVLALACIAVAKRPFLHYWYLGLSPWLLVVGVAFERGRTAVRDVRRGQWIVGAMLGALLVPMIIYRVAGPDNSATIRSVLRAWHEQDVELAALARNYVREGDRLAIWGWRSGLYLELGLAQATRQAHSELQILGGPLQPYHLRTYMADFEKNRPAIFVDAVGPGSFMFMDRRLAHESFSALAEVIRRDYVEIADRHGVRLYVRKDRLAQMKRSASPR